MSQAHPAANNSGGLGTGGLGSGGMGSGGMGYEGKFILAHHFDTPTQQYESGKLAMWLFLVTEILLFGGLFCAYAVYRANHPDIFLFAHTFLDKTLGGVNTIVLLFSSFTMAWAVRAAQLGQRRLLAALLLVTLVCGFGFLGIKAIEYNEKWKHGLLWGENFDYENLQHGAGHGEEHGAAQSTVPGTDADADHGAPATVAEDPVADEHAAAEGAGDAHAAEELAEATPRAPAEGYREAAIRSNLAESALAPPGLNAAVAQHVEHGTAEDIPRNVHIFFGIYFVMTGLHGLHVIAGMVLIGWLLLRSLRGDFGTRNFSAVDLGGLYWHLVDLIWIFLFPLLYLIH